jgi:NADH dehydrogenase FAD-containing subunit
MHPNLSLSLKSSLVMFMQQSMHHRTDEAGIKVVVVGGGAAGIELSLALRARWNDILGFKLSVTLIDSNDVLLPSETSACCSALRFIMEKYNIEVRHNLIVDEVTSSHIHVSFNTNNDGSLQEKVPYTHCIWATGAEAHTLAWDLHKDSGLDISDRGWIRVNHHLQSISHPSVFAAGDCCEMMIDNRKSPPKAGVYAVRSGPILIENLTRFLGVNPHSQSDVAANTNDLIAYHPQDDFLKLLMCGDGTALGFRFGIPLYGKWVWKLKDHIDSMFMDLFCVSKFSQGDATKSTAKTDEKEEDGVEYDGVEYDTSQYDKHESVKERMHPDDAAVLLLRRDDEVDFQIAWRTLREMMADEYYKEDVLSAIHRSPDVWWKDLFVTS